MQARMAPMTRTVPHQELVSHMCRVDQLYGVVAGAGRASGAGGARHEDERPTQLHPGPMHTAHTNSPAFRVSR